MHGKITNESCSYTQKTIETGKPSDAELNDSQKRTHFLKKSNLLWIPRSFTFWSVVDEKAIITVEKYP